MTQDSLFNEASRIAAETQRVSVSLLQRRLGIGYSRASRLIEQMDQAKLDSPRLVKSLQELSGWMRTHAGPSDGVHEMLIEAVDALACAGYPVD